MTNRDKALTYTVRDLGNGYSRVTFFNEEVGCWVERIRKTAQLPVSKPDQ